jgi:hypothetical protein
MSVRSPLVDELLGWMIDPRRLVALLGSACRWTSARHRSRIATEDRPPDDRYRPADLNGRQMLDAARPWADLALVFGLLDLSMEMIKKAFAMEALTSQIRSMIEGRPWVWGHGRRPSLSVHAEPAKRRL